MNTFRNAGDMTQNQAIAGAGGWAILTVVAIGGALATLVVIGSGEAAKEEARRGRAFRRRHGIR